MIPSSQLEKVLMTKDKTGTWPSFYRNYVESSQAVLDEAGLTTKTGKHPVNQQFNRYRDVLPWDQNRIRLKTGNVEYINASPVTGDLAGFPELDRNYILTQGPLEKTVPHFWIMVWEQNVRAIVMLNSIYENKKEKCAQYWPLGSHRGDVDGYSFEGVDLELLFASHEQKESFGLTKLFLRHAKYPQVREISHYQFTSWPDFGVPFEGGDFVALLRAVRASGAMNHGAPPLIVHCSAGLGRSGSFILIDSMLYLIEKNKSIDACDINALLTGFRKCRMSLVQSWDQYRFCYQAVVEQGKLMFGFKSVDQSHRPVEATSSQTSQGNFGESAKAKSTPIQPMKSSKSTVDKPKSYPDVKESKRFIKQPQYLRPGNNCTGDA